ncbi:MAG: hypothetical protein WBA39_08960 [Rivularia sp. (in: cyanobacteria)]
MNLTDVGLFCAFTDELMAIAQVITAVTNRANYLLLIAIFTVIYPSCL